MKRYNPKTFKPSGIYYGMPMADYAAAPGLNASSLKLLLDSPLTYKRQRDGLLARESRPAMQMGTALHSAILEGKLDYHTRPDTYGDGKKWNNNAGECRAWIDAHSDKPILTSDEAAFLAESFSYVRNHPKVTRHGLLANGRPEVSAFATINGRLFKGRFDYYSIGGMITDLKSVSDASGRGLFSAVIKYGWHLQAALYCRIVEELTGEEPNFYWLALQKGQLPLVNVRKFGLSAQLIGNEALENALELLVNCEAVGYWPEWTDDVGNEIKALEVPEWALNDTTQLEDDL